MTQGKGRAGYAGIVAALLSLALTVLLAGCHGQSSGEANEFIPPEPPQEILNEIQPAEFLPGAVVELLGHGFPLDQENLRVDFTPTSGQGRDLPILGVPFKVSNNLITVLTPTGAQTGKVTLYHMDNGVRLDLGSRPITVAPLLIGYIASNTPRIPGVVEGDIISGMSPEEITLYGLNVRNVVSASVNVMAADRNSVAYHEEVSVSQSGFQVEGVSDTNVEGITIPLSDTLSDHFSSTSITYVRFQVRGSGMQSNSIEVPMIDGRNFQIPTSPYEEPMPAFISGVWVNPGVHGNLLEIYYTVFQPTVRLKWKPVLLSSTNGGNTWDTVDPTAYVMPDDPDDMSDSTLVSPNYRTQFLIAGDPKQTPGHPCMAGPGLTYRLIINVQQAWPEGTFIPQYLGGRVNLRLRLESEEESHDEAIDVNLLAPLRSNYVEPPYVAVATNLQGNIPAALDGLHEEEFNSKEYYSSRDTYSSLNSNGQWGVESGIATGDVDGLQVAGSSGGQYPLDETVFESGRRYLYDTDVGRLYVFPDFGANPAYWTAERIAELIFDVRSGIGKNPENYDLEQVWRGLNTGSGYNELHCSRFVLPEDVILYARGETPFVIRVFGAAGGLSAQIDGRIILDGLPGGDGTEDNLTEGFTADAGDFGIGGPGAGNGGIGGLVRTVLVEQSIKVLEALPAEPGEWGGGAGETMTYLLPYDEASQTAIQTRDCFVYGGPGGGGGFGSSGWVGRSGGHIDGENKYTTSSANPWASSGPVYRVAGFGGAERGSEDLMVLLGGSGGGGGGGFIGRAYIDGTIRSFGVGGGGGGGGGGGIRIVVRGSVEIAGKISARGGQGGVGRGKPLPTSGTTSRQRAEWSGACGGGGSGGAIHIQATDEIRFVRGTELDAIEPQLDVTGGKGGIPGVLDENDSSDRRYLESDVYPIGGEGGMGRIRLDAALGVNLPSEVSLDGVFPAPETSTIVKQVNKGTGMHGALDLSLIDYDGINTFYITAPEDAGSLEAANVFYIDPDTQEEMPIIPNIPGSREFHFTYLTIPEGKTLRGIGPAPIVIRIQQEGLIEGTIDVSGFDGGQVEDVGEIWVPGSGGLAGPGGGDGGTGGYGSFVEGDWQIGDAEAGRFPVHLQTSDLSYYVPGEGWNERELPIEVLRAERGLSFYPALLGGDTTGYEDHGGGGGGGGGFGADGSTGSVLPGTLFENGSGGLEYGFHWHLADVIDGFYGGSGGGGGGASTNGATEVSAVPGSGGGGGGGCLIITCGSNLEILGQAQIHADGGAAYSALYTGGNGGGGSGGSILLRINSSFKMGNGVIITAQGGNANMDPGDPNTAASTGGNGAIGRIRIEYPGAGRAEHDVATNVWAPEELTPSVDTVFNGSEIIRYVWSKPIPLGVGAGRGILMTDSQVLESQINVGLLKQSFMSQVVRWNVYVDGSEAACTTAPEAAHFFGPMSDFNSLQRVDLKPTYMRFLVAFQADGSTDEVAEIDWLTIPWNAVDYTIPVVEPPAP